MFGLLIPKQVRMRDRPWRMNTRIGATEITWDGEWQEVGLPLSGFWEMGSWDDNTWFEPQGDFDWTAVDIFQFVAEEGTMTDTELWFDNIRIQGLGVVSSNEELAETPSRFMLNQNYPNPFNPSTQISFELPASGFTTLKVYDALGQEITTLVNGVITFGSHTINFDVAGLSSGVYFYVLEYGNFTQAGKMLLLK